MANVIGLGTVLIDHSIVLDRFPEIDTKNEIQRSWIQVGGPVPTALVVLARLGNDCQFLGKWADDPNGRRIESDLLDEGVGFCVDECRTFERTGFAQVWVDFSCGARTIAFDRGRGTPFTSADAASIDVADVDAVHLDGWSGDAALALAQRVRANNGTVFLDAGSPKPGLDELLEYVEVVICSAQFLRLYLGDVSLAEAGAALLSRGPSRVVITQGERGASLFHSRGRIDRPGFPVDVVDTTGAGDVFCGAFIHASLAGHSDEESLEFACATAALKCAGHGNREAIPTLDRINEYIRSNRRNQ